MVTIIVIGIAYILTALYLLKTNNLNKQKADISTFISICKSALKGFILYTTTGCLLASIIIFTMFYQNGEPHSHNMPELLYIWLGTAGAIAGCIMGFFLSLLSKTSINKKLIIGSLLFAIGSFVWLELL